MKTIYCISGLGADERAFSKLDIKGYQLKVIGWLLPLPGETLPQYAMRMCQSITEEEPILMGLSFGGMLCTEIAKQVPVKKVIIISSIKSSEELPLWMKTVARLKLNQVLPMRSTRLTQPVQNRMLGISTAEEKKLVYEYRKKVPMLYTNWAINQALNWKNDWMHPKTWHIHGDQDNMFPIKYIKPSFVIKNGGHFMIMNKAAEVSYCINAILQYN
jgi:pimeloyl-ACP methyl ester carboxylesterase